MRKSTIVIIPLIITILSFLSPKVVAQRYFSDFKTMKKKVDSYTVVLPIVYVQSYTGSNISSDEKTSDSLSQYLLKKTKSMLSGKYSLTVIDEAFDLQKKEVDSFLKNLDAISKGISQVYTPDFIQDLTKNVTNKYCILSFFEGTYPQNSDPYRNWKNPNSITIYDNSSHSTLWLIIIDKEKHHIVFLDKKSSTIDPRTNDFIDNAVLRIFKPIYYK